MLEKIKTLRDSIDDEQFDEVSEILGDELYKLFLVALNSKEEETAKSRVRSFGTALRGHPMKAFRLYGRLSAEQKTIIQDLMED